MAGNQVAPNTAGSVVNTQPGEVKFISFSGVDSDVSVPVTGERMMRKTIRSFDSQQWIQDPQQAVYLGFEPESIGTAGKIVEYPLAAARELSKANVKYINEHPAPQLDRIGRDLLVNELDSALERRQQGRQFEGLMGMDVPETANETKGLLEKGVLYYKDLVATELNAAGYLLQQPSNMYRDPTVNEFYAIEAVAQRKIKNNEILEKKLAVALVTIEALGSGPEKDQQLAANAEKKQKLDMDKLALEIYLDSINPDRKKK